MKTKKAKIAQKLNRGPLDRCHLYKIKSPHALAKRIGWQLSKLEEMAKNGKYRVFPLDTGRIVEEPSARLQALHRQLHRYLGRIEVPDYLQSAIKGRSYLTNARAHIGSKNLIKIDVKKFFPSVPQYKVMLFFRDTLECAGDVAGLLANLICKDGKLATGSAVSPIISYYAFKDMFDNIEKIAVKNELVMTCYVDDITVSGDKASSAVLHDIRKEIMRSGLKAHKAQTFSGKRPKPVTGVMVTSTGLALPFSRWKKIKIQLKEIKNSDTSEERASIYSSLVSRLYEASQIEPRLRKLAEYHHAKWRALS